MGQAGIGNQGEMKKYFGAIIPENNFSQPPTNFTFHYPSPTLIPLIPAFYEFSLEISYFFSNEQSSMRSVQGGEQRLLSAEREFAKRHGV